MNDSNLVKISLNDQTKFRLNEINKIKDYFNSEIKEREAISKKLSKYIVVFDYADKIFITLSASFGTLSIISHSTVIGIPTGLVGASLTVVFPLTTGIVKKLLNVTRKKKKKHNKIIMLAKSKLNSIETLMSQALIDLDISHEEFKTIANEKEKYEQMKENIRNTKNSREIRENNENTEIFLKNLFFFFVYIKWLSLLLRIVQMQKFTQ